MTEHTQTQRIALVVGGRGKTGRRVAQRLRDRGVRTRIGSRTAEPPFDWEDTSTWAPALHGVQLVYLTFYPDLAVPGSADKVGAFSRLARDKGVTRLVMLSGRGEPEAQRSERAVRDSFDRATIVRSSWFAQNFSESFLLEPVLSGEIALPAGTAAEPFVDAGDLAEVATAALMDEGHEGRLYEVTGSRLMTFADAAAEIAGATGRDVRYRPITSAQFAAALVGAQAPPEVVDLMVELFTVTLDGRNAYVADGVREALGRGPRDFSEYARDTAASGVWDGQVATTAGSVP
jgi:uncharacterized protein YbjT (DUF2867 family)